jgi:catechol 2,3-dioxygenase-like lactoylglutathione lyase family enzyme
MDRILSGIQQVGLGVANAQEAFEWYKKYLGFDVVVFKDEATATLMQQYTGNAPHERLAILALNLQGGGGIEFWQYKNRTPSAANFIVQLGDLGIFAIKIKCRDILKAYNFFYKEQVTILSTPQKNEIGFLHFFIKDLYGNILELIEANDFFASTKNSTAGVCGVIIGVANIAESIQFYKNILAYDVVVAEETGVYKNWENIVGGKHECKRALLTHSQKRTGAFANLFGSTQIELVQVLDRVPQKIYANRYWGDLGFIHVCFDINGMKSHDKICTHFNFPLTVNSGNSFDMGNAAGQFSYNEDPDGTLIEYVETHKVPILKKLGIYLNLKKRNPAKPLPNWVIKCLKFL